MNRKALGTIIGCVLALALVAFVPHARADERDEASQLTFNQPVELPGNHVLQAGTYWFVAPDSVTDGQTVQVFNGDRTELLATMETTSTERPDITTGTQLTFGRVSNRPLMLVSWFYPGEKIGHQFVYSAQLESRLSESNQITVTARSSSAVSVG